MESSNSPLIVTKYRVPKICSKCVPRRPLVEKLASNRDAGLIMVSAPAGYGKTSLLVEWCQSMQTDGVAVAWYSLDETDDNAFVFGFYLAASVAEAIGTCSELEQTAGLLRSSPEIDLRVILPALINTVAAHAGRMVIVLDDYHVITDPGIHRAIASLLEHLPANLCLAIGSRVDPPFPLARLRARGRLVEIRMGDLRFSLSEASYFLNSVMRLDLPAEMVTELETRTEGWVAGLQLATLSLAGRSNRADFIHSFSGSQRYLADYLLAEVVNRLPEEVQSFLLSTSILERLCGPLCDEVTGRIVDSGEIIARLERENHFVIALDDEGSWFRYHHLFREFLLTRLKATQSESIPTLHLRASEWYAQNGYLREAVNHALLSQDWEFAAALVEQQGVALMLHGDYAVMHGWCAAFPEVVMSTHPTLCLFQGNALVFSYRRAYRELVEKRLSQVEQAAGRMPDAALARLFFGQTAVTRTFLAAVIPDPAADPYKHFSLAQKALELISADDPGRSAVTLASGYAYMALNDADKAFAKLEEARQISVETEAFFGIVETAFHQARIAHILGQLEQVRGICQKGREDISAYLAHPHEDLPAVGCLDIAEGCVDLEQNRLESAEGKITRGLHLIGWGMNPFYQMTACLALFNLYEMQNRTNDVLQILDRLAEAWPDITFLTDGLRLLHEVRSKPSKPITLSKVKTWCRKFDSLIGEQAQPPGFGPYGGVEVYYQARLVWIHLQLAQGDSRQVRAELNTLLHHAISGGLVQRIIDLSLLEALLDRQEGHLQGALQAAHRALDAAESNGFTSSFAGGKNLDDLLAWVADNGICRRQIQHIHMAIARAGKGAVPLNGRGEGLVEALSERELEVLRLIAQGASNQAIAARLVISVGTVKSHINHILAKLGAQNRTEAVARAREAGIDLESCR